MSDPQTNFGLVTHWHEKFDPRSQRTDLQELLRCRIDLQREESTEALEAAQEYLEAPDASAAKKAKAHLVKELIDVLTVSYGFLYALNVDADAAFAEVYRSNMTKSANPTGGKALKGEGYQPAQMEQFV